MTRVFGSFRDPSGFVYESDGNIFRQVNAEYATHYDHFISSGLCSLLWEQGKLVRFEEAELPPASSAWKVLRTQRIPFVSFPYEWSFGQLKDAAILTLDIQIAALKHGMILKDASAYNVTFDGGTAKFIDVLSFETWNDGRAWYGYEQFCKHFLAPLLLMSKVDITLHHLLRVYIDGIPLGLASKLLPHRSLLSPTALMHIHAHAWAQNRYKDGAAFAGKAHKVVVTETYLVGLAEQLRGAIQDLSPRGDKTTWGEYYDECDYADVTAAEKLRLVTDWSASVSAQKVLDLGANNGVYSRAVAKTAGLVVSSDFDQRAVDANYQINRQQGITNVVPLVLDLSNPSNGVGWAGLERASIHARSEFDLVMGLALVHHLAIGMHIPFAMIAQEFARFGRYALVEFVPADDGQVKRISAMRPEALIGYTEQAFLAAFGAFFTLKQSAALPQSGRTLHLFERL